MSSIVKKIISDFYSCEPIGVKANLWRIFMHGALGGTGKLIILPVDQGFEHGPDKSFIKNHLAYDPFYHHEFAVDGRLNAYSAPIGMLEFSSQKYFGSIPIILKLNSASSMFPKGDSPKQAFTSNVKDALRLGCSAVGVTIYPGSGAFKSMIEEASEIIRESRSFGLPTVIWSYPRGGDIEKSMENAIDVVAYGAHLACLIGAHVIKVKLPSNNIYDKNLHYGDISCLADRVKVIKRACFQGRRVVLFSGGEQKDDSDVLNDVRSICSGGGDGSIIGRNFFQRSREGALQLLKQLFATYNMGDDR